MYSVADKMFLVMTTETMFKIPKADYLRIWERVAPKWERLTSQEEKKLELMNSVANYIMEKYPDLHIENRLAEIRD